MDYNEHIDHLIDIADQIKVGEFTVLTGNNGTGKSFIRKVLHQFIGNNIKIAEISLNKRAGINGVSDMFYRDCDWLPSSTQSFDFVKRIVEETNRYIVLDEPEIGMSEEFQYALAEFLNKVKDECLAKNKGILLITHSRQLAKNVNCDNFLNIEGMTKDEWVNREVKPLNIDDLEHDTLELMHAIEKRLKKG